MPCSSIISAAIGFAALSWGAAAETVFDLKGWGVSRQDWAVEKPRVTTPSPPCSPPASTNFVKKPIDRRLPLEICSGDIPLATNSRDLHRAKNFRVR